MANDYTSLNAQLNLISPDGTIQFDKDREAAREYHLQHVNQNTVFFHDLKEKLDYLVENDYYEPELIEQYGFDFVKAMFQRAYGYKYRFETFMGAYKFYTSYALKTNSGDRYLERFEDRVVMTSLLLGGGDQEQVKKVLDAIISGRYQPATPTFLNAGRKQRGDYVSCFPGDAEVHTETGHRRIDEIKAGDYVYGHDGQLHRVRNVVVNDNDTPGVAVSHAGAAEPTVLTGNHPVLVHRSRKLTPAVHIPGDGADSDNHLYWVSANMILPGDLVAQPKSFHRGIKGDADTVAAVRITDYHLHSVTGVTEAVIPGDKVYNLEVEDAKTYVVNDMIVHNCYLLRVEDNMESIGRVITNVLQLSKRGGGVGINLSNLRESGAPIKKIENQCSGVVPVMKILENSFSYANQLGARPGAGVVYLNVHHPDIGLFLDTKKENADDAVRIKTLSLGVVIPDITFHLARSNDKMALFSPYDVERVYGKPFSDISVTELYDEMVANDEITKKWVSARDLLQRIAEIQFESGYPYILFEDNANKEHPVRNMGRINMSNLCSEISQYNTPSEYAEDGSYSAPGKDISCNLGSLNIARAFESGDLGGTVSTAIRALTQVSDISDMRAVPSVKKGNKSSHSIGLGQMNLAGFLGSHEIFYGSADAIDFVNAYFGTVLYHALKTSSEIAEEKGETFDGFDGSDYAAKDGAEHGVFFDRYVSGEFDTRPARPKIKELFREYDVKAITPEDWKTLARRVAKTGIYNAYLQAIPPTGSISYINHSTSSIHPIVAKVEIRKEGQIGRVYYPAYGLSDDNLEYYEDAYEVGYEKLIDTYAAAQRHVDQALSLTTFMPDTITTRTLNKMYIYAWRKGIKTLYYVRFRQQALQGTAVNECVSCMV